MITASGQINRGAGLAARMIAFLSVALVPIGLVAYYQTAQLSQQTRVTSELGVVAGTEAAAAPELEVLLRTLGRASALGTLAESVDKYPGDCLSYLGDHVRAVDEVSFVGLITPSGQISCSSSAGIIDLQGTVGLDDMMAHQRPTVLRSNDPRFGEEDVLIVAEPLFREQTFDGYLAVMVPVSVVTRQVTAALPDDMIDLLVFNASGNLLTSRLGAEGAGDRLPAGADRIPMDASGGTTFAAPDADGTRRVFAYVPLVPDLIYAVSVWSDDAPATRALSYSELAVILPLVMWVASVVVAFLAVNRLVIRHIRTIRIQMRRFARSRTMPKAAIQNDMPQELRDVEEDFFHLAEAITQDEARLEDGLREKNILLKEIHHRVKNNLQLISSIMNMHIRQSKAAETRAVLGRLQQRIQGLATIHRNLYQTENLGAVNARALLGELVGELMRLGHVPKDRVKLETNLDPVQVYPDQAVPLSLLVSEAVTNALKYGGPDREGRKWIRVEFKADDAKMARIVIANSLAPDAGPQENAPDSGLGSRLIQAFASQVGGQIETHQTDDTFEVSAQFRLTDFSPDAVDY